ncbi:MAG: sugar phosphate isomerase/epimerase [Bacteroidales bacterium]|nr:sugar phosphate isomerase/epimerase [Bacteroidales bacterium]
MKKFLPLLALLLCACGQKPAEAPKISIFCDHIWTVAHQEGISFREAATKIREIGYDGADVRVLQNPDELRILDSLGFGHACAIADIDYGAGAQPEMEALALTFLETYGYDRLLLVTGLMPEGSTAEDRDAARQRIAAFAKRVTDKGYCIMVEDFDNPRSLCYNMAGLDSLFTLSPTLGHVFDTGNYLFAGDDALVAYDKFRDRIAHVHLKDRVAPDNMHCVPAGSGCIPIAQIVHSLLDSGYDGWLTVEQYGSRQMLSDSQTAYQNVRALLEE